MKKMISSCLMGLTLLFGGISFAETATMSGQCIDGKLYVEPGTVYVGANGIFLNLENNFIPVESVSMDANGVYVTGYNAVRWVHCSNPKCLKWYDADRQSSKCPHGLMVQCPS